jgi:5,10-methylene-tetrahydrofolate dehydrogenase/methenyl tetrahydrofolate cyclohydrolase
MRKISGAEIAQKIVNSLESRPKPKKILAAILVDSISPPQVGSVLSFLKQKEKTAKELGVDFRIYRFNQDLKNDDLRDEVGRIANQKPVGGIIVQLPLPEHINPYYVLNVIPREKDVDVLAERALGAFYTGRNPVLPPAVGVVEEILSIVNCQLSNVRAAVVGLGFLVGKPIAIWLTSRCPEIYLLDEGSNLEILKQVDLVITGVGKPGLIKPEMLKSGAGVIDFGYSIDKSGKIRGDFDVGQLSIVNSQLLFYTPTPGGTGPMLVAKVFENFYKLNA